MLFDRIIKDLITVCGNQVFCMLFIVSQSEAVESALIGGCRASGEPMGFKSKNSAKHYFLSVKCRVYDIEVFLVHLFYRPAEALAETLVVDNLAFAQEADDVVYIRVIRQT